MRNYWLRIALGALAIFIVGMVGVTLAKQGVGRVRHVVEGTGPISLPLAFIPFHLNGQKLGTVSRVVLLREAPKQISAVQLEAKVRDSAVARGLAGCRLTANLDKDETRGDIHIRTGKRAVGVFTCLHAGDSAPGFQEFGRATFQPGNVTVPLLLPDDMVNDLREGHFDDSDVQDSIGAAAEARAESIGDAAEARADSIAEVASTRADSIEAQSQHLVDSLREEGERRADSTRRAGRVPPTPPNPSR
ncbi:MAG TPA: hypothetical protein VIG95_06520 [Gemmatimonadales bacterium]